MKLSGFLKPEDTKKLEPKIVPIDKRGEEYLSSIKNRILPLVEDTEGEVGLNDII